MKLIYVGLVVIGMSIVISHVTQDKNDQVDVITIAPYFDEQDRSNVVPVVEHSIDGVVDGAENLIGVSKPEESLELDYLSKPLREKFVNGVYLEVSNKSMDLNVDDDAFVIEAYEPVEAVGVNFDLEYFDSVLVGDYIPVDFIQGESYFVQVSEIVNDADSRVIIGDIVEESPGFSFVASFSGEEYVVNMVTPSREVNIISRNGNGYLITHPERDVD